MILIRVEDTLVDAEALAALIVIMISTTTIPVAMTLDAEMVISLPCQFTLTSPTLEESLSQGDRSWDMVTQHLFDGDVLILVDILLIGLTPTHLSMQLERRHQGQRH